MHERWRCDMRGADPVAAGDRGQALHRGAEEAAERFGLGLAELRELGGHVGDRAVVLAEFLALRQTAGAARAEAA